MAVPELYYRDPTSGSMLIYHDSFKVNKAGDTMTGNLAIDNAGTASLILDRGADTNYAQCDFRTAGVSQWVFGERAGGSGLHITNVPTSTVAVSLNATTSLATVAGDPTAALGIATKQYVDTAAGGKRIVSVISTSQTAASAAKTDYVYIASAALTLTLPTAVGNAGVYTVKRTGTGTVTVAPASGQTIDGAASLAIDKQWASVDIISDNANWVVINPNEVSIGTVQPTDPATELWVDPNGTWATEFATKPYVDGSGWTNLTMENGWVDYGAPFSPPRYRKSGPMVTVQGLVKSGTVPAVVATLPAGCRPGEQLIFATTSNNAFARMDVLTSGGILANGGTNAYFSICCTFYADA